MDLFYYKIREVSRIYLYTPNTYASIMQYLFHTYEKYRRALNVSCVRFITVLDFFISLFKVTVIGLLIIEIFVVWL